MDTPLVNPAILTYLKVFTKESKTTYSNTILKDYYSILKFIKSGKQKRRVSRLNLIKKTLKRYTSVKEAAEANSLTLITLGRHLLSKQPIGEYLYIYEKRS